jgi:GDPmannose 4,6-dehydratase
VSHLVHNVKPNEIYHLGAQSHVQVSFEAPEYTNQVGALGTTRILEAIRRSGIETRFYNAASSEMFGNAPSPQNEQTPLAPRSPYAASKVHAFWMTHIYREGHGLFATNGILFNHESPRRGETFVTRKITRGIAQIVAGNQEKLYLGNLDARRDWGYAPEYVEAMWMMLQQETPDDFVIGMGESHSVREFVSEAFAYVGLDWEEYVEIDPRYFRPLEVEAFLADPSKARDVLGWRPKVTFADLVKIMMDSDLQAVGLASPGEGARVLKEKFQDWHPAGGQW